jgi:hypothetical protein
MLAACVPVHPSLILDQPTLPSRVLAFAQLRTVGLRISTITLTKMLVVAF